LKIVHALPPNFDAVVTAFPLVRDRAVFFTFGGTIYNPAGVPIPDAIMLHEAVHMDRQGDRVEAWWRRYLEDPEFRLAEEVPAHRAELDWWARQPGINQPVRGFRSLFEYHKFEVARRLSSPLYGRLISLSKAKRLLCAPS